MVKGFGSAGTLRHLGPALVGPEADYDTFSSRGQVAAVRVSMHSSKASHPVRETAIGEMLLVMTRTVFLDHAAASNSMKRVDEASAARASG